MKKFTIRFSSLGLILGGAIATNAGTLIKQGEYKTLTLTPGQPTYVDIQNLSNSSKALVIQTVPFNLTDVNDTKILTPSGELLDDDSGARNYSRSVIVVQAGATLTNVNITPYSTSGSSYQVLVSVDE